MVLDDHGRENLLYCVTVYPKALSNLLDSAGHRAHNTVRENSLADVVRTPNLFDELPLLFCLYVSMLVVVDYSLDKKIVSVDSVPF